MTQADFLRWQCRLASEINDCFDEATHAALKVQEGCGNAIKAMWLGGAKLNEVKEALGHGKWLAWFKRHCPRISIETARRWMRFAKRAHVTDLESYEGRRQALLATGVLPEPQPDPAEEAKQVNFTPAMVTRWASSFTRRIAHEAVLSWPEEDRNEVRETLRPLVELFQKL
jgi:hypothetical protein